MLERPTKETHLGVSTAPAVFESASQVESWRRTVVVGPPLPTGGDPSHGAEQQPPPPPAPPVVLSSSPVAAPATTAPEPTLLAVPPPAVDRPSSSAATAARPSHGGSVSGGPSASAGVGGGPYPASDPLGLFVKRPVPSLAPRPSPAAALERTLSLSSSTGSTSAAARSAPTRTPSLSEASSYADGFHPASGAGGGPGGKDPPPSASSDVCPASPVPLAVDYQPALSTRSLSAGPSPTASPPTAFRALEPAATDNGAPSPALPPVSLLSALLASHSHHTKALSPHPLSSSASASALSSVHHPSAGPSPASSMPNSTASSPLTGGVGGGGAGIHPHLAQSARQRRFSSGACELLGDVGEEEAEVDEGDGEGESAQRGKQQALDEPRLAPALLRPVSAADQHQHQQQALRLPPPPKARIGIPSAKPPSIFLAASPAPSAISHAPSATAATAPAGAGASAASSVRKSSIVFIDDPEIAARRAPELSALTTTPATSDAATTDSSSHAQPSTPELSPAPSFRASLAAYALPSRPTAPPPPPPASSLATTQPPVRRGLSFAEPIKPPLSPMSASSAHALAELGPHHQQQQPQGTPVKKASGLTFAVAAVCARPKALGPEKPVGVLDEDDAGSDDGDDDDAGSDDGDDDEGEEEEDLDEEDDNAVEADGYEEDDEGEGGSDLDLGEREGARYRYRREALFGADSDDDDDSLASSDDGAGGGGGSDSDQAFDETASIRTKTSGRGSIFSNFSGLAPFDGGAGGDDEQGAGGTGTYVQPTTLHHRRSSSLRNRAGYARHSPTLPPIHAAAVGGDPSSPLTLAGRGAAAGPSTSSTTAPAPVPPRRRPLFSFIRGRRGAAPRSPHHAPRLLSNGATGFSPGLAQPLADDGGEPSVERSICRDDFLPSHLKSEEGRAAERRAELQLSSTDGGGGGGSGTGVGRNGQCSRHRSPPPSSSGRERSQDRSASGRKRGGGAGGRSKVDDRRGRGRSQKEPIPPTFDALDRAFPPFRPTGAVAAAANDNDDDQAPDTLRPPSAFALHHPVLHASDGPSLAPPRTKNRRRSYNHGLACRAKAAGGGQAPTPPVFLSEAEADLRSRPIPTPCRRLVDDNWTGDDGGF